MSKQRQAEGILLEIKPLGEKQRLLTFFTKEEGLLKGLSFARNIDPLTVFEFTIRDSTSDLFFFTNLRLIDPLLFLRKDASMIFAAGKMLSTLKKTMGFGLENEPLYELLIGLLHLFQKGSPPFLSLFFQLKLLQKEGVLNPSLFTPSIKALLSIGTYQDLKKIKLREEDLQIGQKTIDRIILDQYG